MCQLPSCGDRNKQVSFSLGETFLQVYPFIYSSGELKESIEQRALRTWVKLATEKDLLSQRSTFHNPLPLRLEGGKVQDKKTDSQITPERQRKAWYQGSWRKPKEARYISFILF